MNVVPQKEKTADFVLCRPARRPYLEAALNPAGRDVAVPRKRPTRAGSE